MEVAKTNKGGVSYEDVTSIDNRGRVVMIYEIRKKREKKIYTDML